MRRMNIASYVYYALLCAPARDAVFMVNTLRMEIILVFI